MYIMYTCHEIEWIRVAEFIKLYSIQPPTKEYSEVIMHISLHNVTAAKSANKREHMAFVDMFALV